MVPALRVGHVERIVDGIGARQQRRAAIEVTQDPVLLKPADVAHFPDRRLEEMAASAQHLRVREVVEQLELDASRIQQRGTEGSGRWAPSGVGHVAKPGHSLPRLPSRAEADGAEERSEEHTSELQSQFHLVCRLLLEKKK